MYCVDGETCVKESAEVVSVCSVDNGSVGCQESGHGCVAAFRGRHHCRQTLGVDGVDVGLEIKQKLNHLLVPGVG